jgi:hypothetical protein
MIFQALNINAIKDNGLIEFTAGAPTTAAKSLLKTNSDFLGDEYSNMMGCIFKLSGVNINLLTSQESNVVINNMAEP